MATRREYLRTLGTAAAAPAAAVAATGVARAEHMTHQPSHVSITYDKSWLERYQPMLVTRELDIEPLALYAWRATSSEFDTDVGVYWAEYPHQEGVSQYDSHYGDHEPFYVFVDTANDQVTNVVYSGYHWLAAKSSTPSLYNDRHPKAHVVSPWHHYFLTTEGGEFVPLADLTKNFQAWLDNGLEEDLHPGTVVNPWRMLSRSDWWREHIAGISLNAIYVNIALKLGIHEADRTDLKQ